MMLGKVAWGAVSIIVFNVLEVRSVCRPLKFIHVYLSVSPRAKSYIYTDAGDKVPINLTFKKTVILKM